MSSSRPEEPRERIAPPTRGGGPDASASRGAPRAMLRLASADEPAGETALWKELEPFLYLLHQAPGVSEAAATAASDGRVLLGCDRLSVVVRRGHDATLEAVSGQGNVNPRGDLAQEMVRLARESLASGEPIVFRGQPAAFPERVEAALADFLRHSTAREVIVVPLFPGGGDSPATPGRAPPHDSPRAAIGCLLVELMGESRWPADAEERLNRIADHVGIALGQALARQRIFLLPLWTRLGAVRERFVGRRRAQALAALGLLAVLVLALALVPGTYRVEADGRLMPATQQRVFAPWDGEVVELHVRAGERVVRDQLLLRIRNDELRSRLVTAHSQLQEKQALAASLQARIGEAVRNGSRDDQTRLQGELARAQVEMHGLAEQARLLEDREAQLSVRSPGDGVVATFQVEQLLQRRPVRRGDALLEVMDESGPWRIEARIPEHRAGHVMRARAALGSRPLPVEYVLATDPERTYAGRLGELSTRAATSDDDRRVIEAFIDLVDPSPSAPRIGAETRARIDCGSRSLGFVLFGDVIEFVQRRAWW